MRPFVLALALLVLPSAASAQDAPAAAPSPTAHAEPSSERAAEDPILDDDPVEADLAVAEPASEEHDDPVATFFGGWKFWVGLTAIALGVLAAVIVDVTTDDPAPSATPMGLVLRF